MTTSDAVFKTSEFRHDVIQYMKRNTTSQRDVASLSNVQQSTLQRFLAGDQQVTLHIACRLAIYADLSLDKYVKDWSEQEAWRDRNMTGRDKDVQDRMKERLRGQVRDWKTGRDIAS